MSVRFTKHAQARANQRCFTVDDIRWIRMFGTEIPDNEGEVYLMCKKDINAVCGSLKKTLQRLERLAGCAAILSGDDVVTMYRATPKGEKRLLRRREGTRDLRSRRPGRSPRGGCSGLGHM